MSDEYIVLPKDPATILTKIEYQMLELVQRRYQRMLEYTHTPELRDAFLQNRKAPYGWRSSFLFAYVGHHCLRCFEEDPLRPSADEYYQQAGDWAKEAGIGDHFYAIWDHYEPLQRAEIPYDLRGVITAGKAILHVTV